MKQYTPATATHTHTRITDWLYSDFMMRKLRESEWADKSRWKESRCEWSGAKERWREPEVVSWRTCVCFGCVRFNGMLDFCICQIWSVAFQIGPQRPTLPYTLTHAFPFIIHNEWNGKVVNWFSCISNCELCQNVPKSSKK